MQKAACCTGKTRWLLIKILLTKSPGMTQTSCWSCAWTKEHNDGLQVSPTVGPVNTAVNIFLDWYQYQKWVHMPTLTKHWYCNCSSVTSPMTLGDPSPTDTRQIPAVQWRLNRLWRFFMEDIHCYNGCKGFVEMENLLLLPEQCSWSFTKTNEQSLDGTYAQYVHKSPHCLHTIRMYSFLGQFTERGSDYNNSNFCDKQLPIMNQFRDWTVLYFCARLLLQFLLYSDSEAAQCLQICLCTITRRRGIQLIVYIDMYNHS